MIKRTHYLEQIQPFYDSDLIKIITGIRRCGKSVILQQIKEDLSEKTDNILYLNFEDRFTCGEIKTGEDLINYVQETRKESFLYLLLDEVQDLDGWQLACKTLRLHNTSVFITGSNSKLLSGEFTKELSGRFVSFRIRTFVYKELSDYGKQLGKEVSITDYLVWGGFPGRLEQHDEESSRRYLNDLDSTIVLNDLIRRYNIRKTQLFSSLVDFILRSNARIFSANSICTYINEHNESCSVHTVMKYLGYLESAYIIDHVKKYSTKTKTALSYYEKIYDSDVALNSIRCPDNRFDLTHNMENIVYNELIFRNYTVTVYDNNGREIDFLCEKQGKKIYVQVSYSIEEDKTYEREMKAFSGLSQLDRKIIITNDELDYSTSNVHHIRLKDFLTSDDF